jgi:diketogulonate reductase-like aldo/keto reductase
MLPQVGLGVFRAGRGEETEQAVALALAAGYRHIDTARLYANEHDVGIAVRKSGIPRDEVFITTKLWNDDQGYDQALQAFDKSMRQLGVDVLDLYLLHWPVPGKRLDSWRALERLHDEGRVRSIGVSNFMERHLEELLRHARIVPEVNQIEVHPFLQRRSVRAMCAKHGIVVEAYSPLTKGQRLSHPVVRSIAQRVGRSPAQVMLRWGIQHELVVLPKSTRKERIHENLALFDFILEAADMARLDALEEGLATGWNPEQAP